MHGLGSGKTRCALACAEGHRDARFPGKAGPSLMVIIVAPAKVQGTWEQELTVLPKARRRTYEFVSYEWLTRNVDKCLAEATKHPTLLIFDEAHRLRNMGTAVARAALRLRIVAHRVLLLTATPAFDAPSDIVPLINLAAGHVRLPHDGAFDDLFVDSRGTSVDKAVAITTQVAGVQARHPLAEDAPLATPRAWLRAFAAELKDAQLQSGVRLVKALFLSKKDLGVFLTTGAEPAAPSRYVRGMQRLDTLVARCRNLVSLMAPSQAGLPSSTRQNHHVQLTREQYFRVLRARFEEIMLGIKGLRSFSRRTNNVALGRFDEEEVEAEEEAGASEEDEEAVAARESLTVKFDQAMGIIVASPKPALVFSFFLGTGVHFMRDKLDKRGLRYLLIDGATPDSAAVVAEFNARSLNGTVDVLLLSGAAGEGIDLKGVRQVHILEPQWNENRVGQAVGRAIRFRSHAHLPLPDQHVDVHYYDTVPPDRVPASAFAGGKSDEDKDKGFEASALAMERLLAQAARHYHESRFAHTDDVQCERCASSARPNASCAACVKLRWQVRIVLARKICEDAVQDKKVRAMRRHVLVPMYKREAWLYSLREPSADTAIALAAKQKGELCTLTAEALQCASVEMSALRCGGGPTAVPPHRCFHPPLHACTYAEGSATPPSLQDLLRKLKPLAVIKPRPESSSDLSSLITGASVSHKRRRHADGKSRKRK